MTHNVKTMRPDLGTSAENARKRFDEILDRFDTVGVAFSGGKDSGCALSLTFEAIERNDWDGELHISHIDDEFVLPETEEFVKRIAKRKDSYFWWSCLPVQYTNYATNEQRFFYPWHPDKEDLWIREKPDLSEYPKCKRVDLGDEIFPDFEIGKHEHRDFSNAIAKWVTGENQQWCGVTGVRSNESMNRMRAITSRGSWIQENAIGTDSSVVVAHPLYDITDRDLWKLYFDNGWDYNHAYDKLVQLGKTPGLLRTAQPYVNAQINLNDHDTIRKMWPELMEKAERRVNGAEIAFRHGGMNALYNIRKKDDQSWKERMYELLGQLPEDQQQRTANTIQSSLDSHWERSSIPIRETSKCPYCGCSWKSLANRAYKERHKLEIH